MLRVFFSRRASTSLEIAVNGVLYHNSTVRDLVMLQMEPGLSFVYGLQFIASGAFNDGQTALGQFSAEVLGRGAIKDLG
jgi:hypothetical protein